MAPVESPQPVTTGILAPFSAGLGFQDFIPLPTPGAGANASFTVPGDFSMRILAATGTLVTAAAAANRFVALDYIIRGTTVVRNACAFIQTASLTVAYHWNFERTHGENAANTPIFSPLLGIDLQPGYVVQFTVDTIQGADQLQSLSLLVEKFETGDRGYPRGIYLPSSED